MKLILSLSLAVLLMSSTVETVNWLVNMDDAKAQSVQSNKKILLKFSGSDWCANCKRLDKQFFQSTEFIDFAKENLVLLEADFPSRKKNALSDEQVKHNEALAEQYNKKGIFPLVLVLDAEGKVLGELKQPKRLKNEYISQLQSFIK